MGYSVWIWTRAWKKLDWLFILSTLFCIFLISNALAARRPRRCAIYQLSADIDPNTTMKEIKRAQEESNELRKQVDRHTSTQEIFLVHSSKWSQPTMSSRLPHFTTVTHLQQKTWQQEQNNNSRQCCPPPQQIDVNGEGTEGTIIESFVVGTMDLSWVPCPFAWPRGKSITASLIIRLKTKLKHISCLPFNHRCEIVMQIFLGTGGYWTSDFQTKIVRVDELTSGRTTTWQSKL